MPSSEKVAEDVKQARELALMGNYEDAKTYYSVAIQAVQQMLRQMHEPDKKQKWREVRILRTGLNTL